MPFNAPGTVVFIERKCRSRDTTTVDEGLLINLPEELPDQIVLPVAACVGHVDIAYTTVRLLLNIFSIPLDPRAIAQIPRGFRFLLIVLPVVIVFALLLLLRPSVSVIPVISIGLAIVLAIVFAIGVAVGVAIFVILIFRVVLIVLLVAPLFLVAFRRPGRLALVAQGNSHQHLRIGINNGVRGLRTLAMRNYEGWRKTNTLPRIR